MTQIALHEHNALYLLVSRGFSPQEARDTLDQLTPAATYDQSRYYQPSAIYSAATKGAYR